MIEIEGNRIDGDKLIIWFGGCGGLGAGYRQYPVLQVNPTPIKKMGTGGGWFVETTIEINSHQERHIIDFWYKKNALKAIEYLQSNIKKEIKK